MERVALLAVTLLLASGVGVAVGTASHLRPQVFQAAVSSTRLPVVCSAGAKRAVIGGRVQCLRIGLRCNVRFNTTKPSYTRYGFFCALRTGSDPTTLFRIAQPGLAPSACPGLGPALPQTAPAFRGIGASPFYVGPVLALDPSTNIWRYWSHPGLLGADGWAVKFLWYVAAEAVPARISITELDTSQPLAIVVAGEASSQAPLLEPSTAFSYPEHTWGSYVVFPRAGCYRLDAQWQGGSWSLVFSFGR